MTKKISTLFFVSGILFFIYSAVLFKFTYIPDKLGMMVNIIFFIFDCFWFSGLGIFYLFLGVIILRTKHDFKKKIQLGGHLLVFTLVFLFSSFIFNLLASPALPSSGRVFTFFWQTLSRIVNPPSISSFEFLVPVCGIVIYIIAALWFQKSAMKKIDAG